MAPSSRLKPVGFLLRLQDVKYTEWEQRSFVFLHADILAKLLDRIPFFVLYIRA